MRRQAQASCTSYFRGQPFRGFRSSFLLLDLNNSHLPERLTQLPVGGIHVDEDSCFANTVRFSLVI